MAEHISGKAFEKQLYEVIDLFSRSEYEVEVYSTIAGNDVKNYIQEHDKSVKQRKNLTKN